MPTAAPMRADNGHVGHEKARVETWLSWTGGPAPTARQPVGGAKVAYRLDDAVCDSSHATSKGAEPT